MELQCEWFAGCDRPTMMAVEHPVLGWVPCCQRCSDAVGGLDRFEVVLTDDGDEPPWGSTGTDADDYDGPVDLRG